MEDFQGKDFLGNQINNGDFAIISRYSTLYPVIVTHCDEKAGHARFVYVNDYNKGQAENGKRLNGGILITRNFIKSDPNSLNKDSRVREGFEIIKRRIKTIE